MRGLVADHNAIGHLRLLLSLFEAEPLRTAWTRLGLTIEEFDDLDLQRNSSDKLVWLACQEAEVVLVTANRRKKGVDSLAEVIETLGKANSLPVFTLANPKKVFTSKVYARRVAEEMLRYLMEIDDYRGTGRLYVP